MSKGIDELFKKSLPMIKFLARRYSTIDPAVGYEDLISEGYIAVGEAVKNYVFKKNVSFQTYLWWVLKKRFQSVLRNGSKKVVEVEDRLGNKKLISYSEFQRQKVFLEGKKWRVVSLNISFEEVKDFWKNEEGEF